MVATSAMTASNRCRRTEDDQGRHIDHARSLQIAGGYGPPKASACRPSRDGLFPFLERDYAALQKTLKGLNVLSLR